MNTDYDVKPCDSLSESALFDLWAEPLDQADEEIRLTRSHVVVGGRYCEVIVIVRASPMPVPLERSARQVTSLGDQVTLRLS